MAFNPRAMLKAQERLNIFNREHPKFMPFLEALKQNAVCEGTILEIKAETPAGKHFVSNIRLTANDVETIRMMLENS